MYTFDLHVFKRLRLRTSYHQPVHQIWICYVYSLRRYERRRKMQKFTWFEEL